MTASPEDRLDLVIRRGRVLDGSGGPIRLADVGVLNGRIVHVGDLAAASARETIDAGGLAVAPGFVDAHVHSEARLGDASVQLASLAQGVTTHVVGQDGFGFAPTSAAAFDFVAAYTSGINGRVAPPGPMTVAELLEWFDGRTPLNVATLVPNGCLRLEVMGNTPREPTTAELEAMAGLCACGLDEGAVGLSSGLDYVPSCHATTGELAAVCAALRPSRAPYVTHVRYDLGLDGAVAEAFEIGAAAGVPVHVSHLRPDRALELSAAEIVALVDAARGRGVDVTYDLYPYTYSATFLPFLLPHWVFEGDRRSILDRLGQAETRTAARREREESRWTWNDATIAGSPSPPYDELVGLGLEDAARRTRSDPVDFVCDFLVAEQLACLLVWRDDESAADRAELQVMLSHPAAMIGSDGIYTGGRDHARGYGAFARFLGEFVRDDGLLTLEEAVRRVTSLPASRFGLADRGRLERGCAADVVVFDPDAIEAPRAGRFASGVRDVLVNGVPVFRDGAPTGALPGRGLRSQVETAS